MKTWPEHVKRVVASASMVLMAGLLFFAANGYALEPVTLKIYQGVKFSDGTVVKSDDKAADLSFYVNRGRRGALSFELAAFGAKGIKEFGEKKPEPAELSLETAGTWKDHLNAPAAGYYGVLGADGNSVYLVEVLAFENQGQASAHWAVTLKWEPAAPR